MISFKLPVSSFLRRSGCISRYQSVAASSQAQDAVEESTEFVNHALNMWTEKRREWTRRRLDQPSRGAGPVLSWNETYEGLLTHTRRFRKPVPLPEMVDFLVDVWEQEGLFDACNELDEKRQEEPVKQEYQQQEFKVPLNP